MSRTSRVGKEKRIDRQRNTPNNTCARAPTRRQRKPVSVMDRPEPHGNRALLIRALRARLADPDRGGGTTPPHDSDFDTLDMITRRASARLAEAIGIVARTEGCGYARHRSALAHVERLEYGAHMPLVVRSLCDTPHEHDTLIGWLDTLRRLYEAFWRAVAATPSVVPLRGMALGDPPTPRSVDRWLRAHLGSDIDTPAQMDRADAPLQHPRQWAAAAGNAIESLWRYAAQGTRRVPDVWPARRALLWQHGACAPETLFVLAVAQDIVTSRIADDAKGDGRARDSVGQDNNHGATHDHVNGTRDDAAIVNGHASANMHGADSETDTRGHDDAYGDDDDDDGDAAHVNVGDSDNNDGNAMHQPYAEQTLFTRTAVLYAALRTAPASQEAHALRVVCHASLVFAIDSQSDPALDVFTSVDASALLASLSLPPAVPWTTVEAVQRWLAFLANGGSLSGITRSLLAPRPEPAPDLVAQRAKAAGDTVRGSLDDAKHDPLGPFASARQHQQQRPYGARILIPYPSFFFIILLAFWFFRITWRVVVVSARARVPLFCLLFVRLCFVPGVCLVFVCFFISHQEKRRSTFVARCDPFFPQKRTLGKREKKRPSLFLSAPVLTFSSLRLWRLLSLFLF